MGLGMGARIGASSIIPQRFMAVDTELSAMEDCCRGPCKAWPWNGWRRLRLLDTVEAA
jgi:hypothetical protein